MSPSTEAIRELDDADAERIVQTLAQRGLQPAGNAVTKLDADLAAALTQAVEDVPPAGTATQGELAKATLLLLAEDPKVRPVVEAMAANPEAQKYSLEPVTAAALVAATLIALQTYVKIEYDQKKGWRVKIERKPLNESLLGQVIGLLRNFTTGK